MCKTPFSDLLTTADRPIDLATVQIQAPIDAQEVWGAGVTYERSKVARQEESEQGGTFYDLVYRAPRPELFFKATPSRVVGPNRAIRVRKDSAGAFRSRSWPWSSRPDLELVGFTIGNDVSARDIEGENPLYLPQAKVYNACCALGPAITLAPAMPPVSEIEIRLAIDRGDATVWEGSHLGRKDGPYVSGADRLAGPRQSFPEGVILLTGTGIVPPDDFSLQPGDLVRITISGIGTLVNPVVQ